MDYEAKRRTLEAYMCIMDALTHLDWASEHEPDMPLIRESKAMLFMARNHLTGQTLGIEKTTCPECGENLELHRLKGMVPKQQLRHDVACPKDGCDWHIVTGS